MNDKYQTRIPKKRAVSQLIGKKNFHLKVPNRFFYRVLPEKGPLLSEETKPQNIEGSLPLKNEYSLLQLKNEEGQSETSHLTHKFQDNGLARTLKQAYSLPEIKKKTMAKDYLGKEVALNQILKSQLGCFSYFEILEKRQQAQRKRREFLTRNSSFVSQEDTSAYLLSTNKEQASYEQYDNRLMQVKCSLSRAKKIRFTHKVDWSISK